MNIAKIIKVSVLLSLHVPVFKGCPFLFLQGGGRGIAPPPHREVNQDPIFSFGRGVMVVSLVEVTFIKVVFVIAHCRNMHNIAPHGVTAAEALISTSAVVQEGSAKHL